MKEFVNTWAINYPIDRWWRDKHHVAFNSPVHRQACFIDMLFEFIEDKIYGEVKEEEDKYIPGFGDIFKDKPQEVPKLSDEEFFSIDLKNFKLGKREEAEKI